MGPENPEQKDFSPAEREKIEDGIKIHEGTQGEPLWPITARDVWEKGGPKARKLGKLFLDLLTEENTEKLARLADKIEEALIEANQNPPETPRFSGGKTLESNKPN